MNDVRVFKINYNTGIKCLVSLCFGIIPMFAIPPFLWVGIMHSICRSKFIPRKKDTCLFVCPKRILRVFLSCYAYTNNLRMVNWQRFGSLCFDIFNIVLILYIYSALTFKSSILNALPCISPPPFRVFHTHNFNTRRDLSRHTADLVSQPPSCGKMT